LTICAASGNTEAFLDNIWMACGKVLSDDLWAAIINLARHLMSTTSSNTQAVNDVQWNVLSQTIVEDMEW